MENEINGKRILVTGGTGSIGSVIVRRLLEHNPKQIRILSRDETKQHLLLNELGGDSRLRFLIGDIRDADRVDMAMEDIDIVFHAAAMKHVVSCENDPFEAVKTNVIGTQNIINKALANGVEKVIGISTDKATDPVSVMGCTKLLAEKVMLASHTYQGSKMTKFCFVRFGNVLSTRGSVIPLFYSQIQKGGPVTVTDENMSRFFLSIHDAVGLVFEAMHLMQNREIFVLKMPILNVRDLAVAMTELYGPSLGFTPEQIQIHFIGKKKGERIFEKLLTKDESEYALETDEMFIITPVIGYPEEGLTTERFPDAKKCRIGDYSTEGQETLSIEEIKEMLKKDADSLRRVLVQHIL